MRILFTLFPPVPHFHPTMEQIEDNILSDGYLRSEDLHEEHPIQQGMDAMEVTSTEDEE